MKSGEKVDERDIKKHRNDVARLLQLLPADTQYSLPDSVRDDMEQRPLAGTIRSPANISTGRKSNVSDLIGQKFPNDLSAHHIHGGRAIFPTNLPIVA